jgi:hypothetical protein
LIQQRRIAELEAQVVQLSAMVAALRESQQLSAPELRLLSDRISVLIDLQRQTYIAVSARRATPYAAAFPIQTGASSDGSADSQAFDQDISLSEPPAEYRISTRTLLRTLDRLHLSPEQRRTLMLSLHPSRSLDPDNPWAGRDFR